MEEKKKPNNIGVIVFFVLLAIVCIKWHSNMTGESIRDVTFFTVKTFLKWVAGVAVIVYIVKWAQD